MATTPATATAEEYGIATTATGITIESETITESPQVETIPDQAETAGQNGENSTVTYNGVKYYVDSHESAGSYNGLKRYNLSAHRFDNAPAQS